MGVMRKVYLCATFLCWAIWLNLYINSVSANTLIHMEELETVDVTIKELDDLYMEITISGNTNVGEYLSVGFSQSDNQDRENMVVCMHRDTVMSYSMFREGNAVTNLTDSSFTSLFAKYSNGRLTCRSKRLKNPQQPKIFSIDQPLYVGITKGNSLTLTTNVEKYYTKRTFTREKINIDLTNSTSTLILDTVMLVYEDLNNGTVSMTISSNVPSNGYISIGFSKDRIMADDSVVACVRESPAVTAHLYYNTGHSPPSLLSTTSTEVNLISSSYTNGTLTCEVHREKNVAGAPQYIFDINKQYYIMSAKGVSTMKTQLKYHSARTVTSGEYHLDYIDISVPFTKKVISGVTLSYRIQEANHVEFIISGNVASNHYIAFGLSDDTKMGDDSVVACLYYNGAIVSRLFYNDGHTPNILSVTSNDIKLLSGQYASGRLTCHVRRIKKSIPRIYNPEEPYYIMFATGALSSLDQLTYHKGAKMVTSDKYSFDSLLMPFTTAATTTMPTSAIAGARASSVNLTGVVEFCPFVLQYEDKKDGFVEFIISGPVENNEYIALGFSTDKQMGDDSVIACINYNNNIAAVLLYTTGYAPLQLVSKDPTNIMLLSSSYTDGTLKCHVKRVKTAAPAQSRIFDLIQQYYMFMAHGASKSAENVQKHDVTPDISEAKIDIQITTNTSKDACVGGTTVGDTTIAPSTTENAVQPPEELTGTVTFGNYDVQYQDSADGFIEFILRGPVSTGSYLAIGFSHDRTMGDDSVIACINYNGKTAADILYTTGYAPLEFVSKDTKHIVLVSSSYDNGILKCRIKRVKTSTDNPDRIFDLTKKYYMFLAHGASESDVNVQKHSATPMISSALIDVQIAADNEGSAGGLELKKLHACFMLIAWILCGNLAAIMARHYKKMWPDTKIMKLHLWFQIHRGLMITVLLLTCISFIVIFLQVDGYSMVGQSDGDNRVWMAHPILGIIVTALTVLNPIIALFRCGPGTPKRPIFNWIHFSVGNLARVVSIITIVIGFNMSTWIHEAGFILTLVYLAYEIVMEVLFEFITRAAENAYSGNDDGLLELQRLLDGNLHKPKSLKFKNQKTKIGDLAMHEMSTTAAPQVVTSIAAPSKYRLRLRLYIFHAIVLTAFTIALVVLVAVA